MNEPYLLGTYAEELLERALRLVVISSLSPKVQNQMAIWDMPQNDKR